MKAAAIAPLLILLAIPAALAQVALDGGNTVQQPLGGLKTDKPSYKISTPVKLTFVIENRTQSDMVLRFSSGQQFDFWAEKDGKEVWRWSRGKMFTQALTSTTLRPGEKKTFQGVWNQTTNKGEQVAPGAYDIFAQLTTMGARPTPVKASVSIGTGRSVVTQSTVSGVVDNAGSSVGKVVSISGTYLGWKADSGSPACRPGPPVLRSDWAVSDTTGCIYVTGQSGLDPTDDYGKSVTVVGTVRITDKGQPYIEAKQVFLGK
jgi:hypothetical protein